MEYEKLLDGDIEDMILFYIGLLLLLVGNVVNIVDSNMVVILYEL